LDLIVAEIQNGIFEFEKRFPHSNKKDHFTRLEGKMATKAPSEVLFGDYVKVWWKDMKPGMSIGQIEDYTTILNSNHLPYFGKMPFSEVCSKVRMKKYVAHLQGKKNRYKDPLSAKRIQNIMIPLRVIVRDAIDEYDWRNLTDPFIGLKLPRIRKIRVKPFNFEEWKTLMAFMLPWYRPYFEVAVQTRVRPSEQVALKWAPSTRASYILSLAG
jgi:integrase